MIDNQYNINNHNIKLFINTSTGISIYKKGEFMQSNWFLAVVHLSTVPNKLANKQLQTH